MRFGKPHLLARKQGFAYGTMRMAQRSFCGDEVCFARSYLASFLFLGLGLVASGAEVKRDFHQLVSQQGTVEVLRKGANAWIASATNATLNTGDAIRTGPSSRAAILLANDSVLSM